MTTATNTTELRPLADEQALLRTRLARLRRRLRLEMALELALEVAAVVVATGVLLVLLDWWFRLGSSARVVLFAATLLSLLPYATIRTIRRWRAGRLDDLSLAMTLDRFRPGTGGRIADVLQLPDLLNRPTTEVSPALVHRAVRNASEALATSDWATLWNRGRSVRCGALLALALAVPIAFTVVAPLAARLSAARWLLGSNERWPQHTYLSIPALADRSRLLVPRDEPFTLEVVANAPPVEAGPRKWVIPGRGELFALRNPPRKPRAPRAVRVRERTAKGTVRDAVMTATGPTTFRYELPPSSNESTLEVTGGDDWLGPLTIERVDRPTLTATKLRVREPGDPGEGLRTVDQATQHPVFLPDTQIELTLVGSEPVEDVRVTVNPGAPPRLDRVDPKSFATRWLLREATTLEIQLSSRVTGLQSKPAFLSIGLLKDRVPRVTLRALGVGAHVTPVATIPLSFAATDDRGIAALRLQLDRTTASEKGEPKTARKTVPLPLSGDKDRAVLDHQGRQDVDLATDPPATGTLLRFVAEADDRCARGTQVGRSAALQMQVVPPDELFYEILIRQRAERTKFVALLDAAEKRGSSLLGESTSDGYATALRGLHTDARQLELIAGRIADTLQEMKLNQVGSPKSHRLLQEGVIDPLRALGTGPVAELRNVLQSLAGSGPKTNASADEARRLHGELVSRMKVILEQMSQWESFVDVVNQVAEVIKMQQNVLKAAEKARESRTQEVFDEKP